MTKSELRERVNKVSDADYAQQCWHLLFDVENEYWMKIYDFFREAADGKAELNKQSLEWAQGYARAAIEDLEKLCNVLEAKKEAI